MTRNERKRADEELGEAIESALEALFEGRRADWDALRAKVGGDAGRFGGLEHALQRYGELMEQIRSLGGHPLLVPGDRVGDFEVAALLARGGMSEVYRANQVSLGGRPVALKVISGGDTADVARFEREALILSKLHHPCLAEVYGFGRTGDVHYLAMELVDGPNLTTLARRDEPSRSPRDIVRLLCDVAEALDCIHAAGLVHRDVKPSNIVLRRRGVPFDGRRAGAVLVDFGLVRPVEGWTRTRGLAPLTVAYAAPEQLLGANVDARADVFSLGAVLHDLLAKRLGQDRQPAASGLPPLPDDPGVDKDLLAVVSKATAGDKEARYRSAADLRADFEAWLAGRPVAARRGELDRRIRRFTSLAWKRWRPWLRKGALAAGIVAVLGWGVALSRTLERIRQAGEGMDLPEVRRLSSAVHLPVPVGFLGALLQDSRLAETVLRFRREPPDAVLESITACQQEDDLDGALFGAAAQLHRVGLDGDPLLLSFLIRPVVAGGNESLRARALTLLTLLADQRPFAGGRPGSGAERLNEIARSILASDSSTSFERLCGVSILGSTARPGAALWLCNRALKLPPGTEEGRLCYEGLERILRTAEEGEVDGLLEELPFSDLEERILAERQGSFEPSWGIRAARSRFLVRLYLERRARHLRPNLIRTFPPPGFRGEPSDWIELAAAGDRRSLGVLETLEPARIHAWQADVVGTVLAYVGVEDRLREGIRALVRCGWDPHTAREALEEAVQRGLREIEGWSAADDPKDGGRFEPFVGVLEREPLKGKHCGPSQNQASWFFGARQGTERRAGALEPWGRAIQLRREGGDPAYVLFPSFGLSTLELPFDLSVAEERPSTLRLKGQTSSHRYLPYEGLARIDVALDGQFLGTLTVSHTGQEEDRLEIPGSWLPQGSHCLSLHLAKGSTTSYRLVHARIVRQ